MNIEFIHVMLAIAAGLWATPVSLLLAEGRRTQSSAIDGGFNWSMQH